MSTSDLFNGWEAVLRSAVMATSAYLVLIILLRLSGKRTLTNLNVFDFVFVVALGSTLADTILSKDVSLAEGLTALFALILVQVFLSWIITRSKTIETLVNGNPTLIFLRGKFLHEMMRRQRVTEEEIKAAVREEGLESLEDVEAIVIETDGTFSVIEHRGRTPSSLTDVKGYAEPA